MFQRRRSAKKKKTKKHAMISNRNKDWCDIIHMRLPLTMHTFRSVHNYALWATRHPRSYKSDTIVTYWVFKEPKKCFSFYVGSFMHVAFDNLVTGTCLYCFRFWEVGDYHRRTGTFGIKGRWPSCLKTTANSDVRHFLMKLLSLEK